YGPIVGLVGGVAGILTGILNSGWSSDLLDDHRSFQPNEGIHRSLRHAVFAASLFGPLGGLASGLVSGFAFGLVGGLSGWPILGMGFGLAFGLIFALQFAMVHGGIAYIEHYLLRWYLWRAGSLPWNYLSFLDYADERLLLSKVGGGYMFYHQLLHDYFVAPDKMSPSDNNASS
ncbi:MAG TPA: hypothetical protein VFV38_41085, partial [Ktedonobacteraceae bacterium]|nr:hypothetical protein [Ktedonobacteraceae bacterium]